MTTTYSGDPSDSPKDKIRFILSDKGPQVWKWSDEEIDAMVADFPNVYNAAAELAMYRSTEYTDRRDKTVGPLSIKYGEIGDRWMKLADNLRKRGARSSGALAIMTQRTTGHMFALGMHDFDHTLADESLKIVSNFNDGTIMTNP